MALAEKGIRKLSVPPERPQAMVRRARGKEESERAKAEKLKREAGERISEVEGRNSNFEIRMTLLMTRDP